jgi:hypothetical protein
MFFSAHHMSAWFAWYASHVPLGWFVLGGSFLEEFVSPIPAMFITGLAGSIALVRHEEWWYLGAFWPWPTWTSEDFSAKARDSAIKLPNFLM